MDTYNSKLPQNVNEKYSVIKKNCKKLYLDIKTITFIKYSLFFS